MAHFSEVDINAQRLVVEALGQRNFQAGRHVLCHSASDICSNNGLLVTTHDRLYELLTHPYKTNRKSTKNSTIPSFFFAGKLLDLSGRLGDG